MDQERKAISLLGSADLVALDSATTSTVIYTVLAGHECTLDHVRIRNLTGDATTATCTVGQTGALTDFLNTQTLSALNAAAATGKLMPIPSATTAKGIEYPAGTVINFRTVAAGAAVTCTVEAWGAIAPTA